MAHPLESPESTDFFDNHFAHLSDRGCWESFSKHFTGMDSPLPEQLIRDTPLPVLMEHVKAMFADGTIKLSPRWLPFIERAFRYVQTRN